jgi:LytS/YehU family sensor histidine kinase
LLRKEIDHLQTYIELEKQRFEEDDFEFKIHIDQILELDSIEVPSMILQPFVENAIKHGLLHKVGKKKLDVSFQHFEKNALMVEIEDNGIGRKAATIIRDKRQRGHKSFATSSIQQRIELMNKLMEKPIRLQVVDKKDSSGKPTGTKILIVIPYESNFS